MLEDLISRSNFWACFSVAVSSWSSLKQAREYRDRTLLQCSLLTFDMIYIYCMGTWHSGSAPALHA